MPILPIILVLIVIGVALWAFNTYVTAIDPRFKQLINIIVVLCVVVYLLKAFGIWSYLASFHT